MHRFITSPSANGTSSKVVYTEVSCYCTSCSIGNLTGCKWQGTHVPALKEIHLGFSLEDDVCDIYLRNHLSRKKRQLAVGNLCIVRTEPSEYGGLEFLTFTVNKKETVKWNSRDHSNYGGVFSAGDEVVFVREDFKMLTATFVDGVPTVRLSRANR
ncbi:unnamed protein product, partial [Choristocarpus tenellus]